jgi:hypothetical protein
MPIPIEEFATPTWVRYRTRYVGNTTTDKKDRFPNYEEDHKRSWRGPDGWKQAGYNPNHQSTRIEKINLYTDDFTLKPR